MCRGRQIHGGAGEGCLRSRSGSSLGSAVPSLRVLLDFLQKSSWLVVGSGSLSGRSRVTQTFICLSFRVFVVQLNRDGVPSPQLVASF